MSIKDTINKKDFLMCVRESKTTSLAEKKEYTRISKKKVMRTRFAQLYVTGMYSNRQIADMLCVSLNTIYKLLREKDVKEMIENYQGEEKDIIDAKLKALREQATETLFDLLTSEEDSVRLQTAKTILDKTGHGDKKEQTTNVNISYEERLKGVIEGVSFNVQDLEYMPMEE